MPDASGARQRLAQSQRRPVTGEMPLAPSNKLPNRIGPPEWRRRRRRRTCKVVRATGNGRHGISVTNTYGPAPASLAARQNVVLASGADKREPLAGR